MLRRAGFAGRLALLAVLAACGAGKGASAPTTKATAGDVSPVDGGGGSDLDVAAEDAPQETAAEDAPDAGCLPLSCDDGNPCTADSCVGNACVHDAVDGWSCDDGEPCTVGDVCTAGTCVGAPSPCACPQLAGAQEAYLKADKPAPHTSFAATALDGDTLAVGAPGPAASGVYVFAHNAGTWTQTAHLAPPGPVPNNYFGISLALSGDTMVVGATLDSSAATGIDGDQANTGAPYSGAAYVFVRQGNAWKQQAYLKASNTDAVDDFGWTVAISGDTIVVGAPNEGSGATGVDGKQDDNSAAVSGAAYIFRRKAGVWHQEAYVKASNTNAAARFGESVAISGTTVVVGAEHESSKATGVDGDQSGDGAKFSGAAYVFERKAGLWQQQAYLKGSNTSAFDWFGFSVAISGDTIIVGAPLEDSGAPGAGNQTGMDAKESGAAYIFVRKGGKWTQQALLKASNAGQSDNFGGYVAVSGELAVVGAMLESSAATGVNGVQSDDSASQSGAAYAFIRQADQWVQHAYLKASNPDSKDYFGVRVAVAGSHVAVGASMEAGGGSGPSANQADNSAEQAGAVYVFGLDWPCDDANPCTQDACQAGQCVHVNSGVPCDDGDACSQGDNCQGGVCLPGTGTLDCDDGNPCTTDTCQGGACLGTNSGGACDDGKACTKQDTCVGGKCAGVAVDCACSAVAAVLEVYAKSSNTGPQDWFGASLAIDGDTMVVGAPQESSSATGVGGNQASNAAGASGAAYVFARENGVWKQSAYLKASNTGAQDAFGSSVAISGHTVVVGAPEEDSSATGVNGDQSDNGMGSSGAAYVFVSQDGVWTQQAYLKASTYGGRFGGSVAISGETIVVGAPWESSNTSGIDGVPTGLPMANSGAAFVFARKTGVWKQQAFLKASNAGLGDQFGVGVGIAGDTIVVGACNEGSSATGIGGKQDDDGANLSGAAYVFGRNAGVWTQQAYLKASNTDSGDRFGINVAIAGATVVVGAFGESSSAKGVGGVQVDNSAVEAGAAYVFVVQNGTWSQQAYLKASNTASSQFFGTSVAVYGDVVVIGADGEDSAATGVDGWQSGSLAGGDSGAAYVFGRQGGVWSQRAYLKASNTGPMDSFGAGAAVSGATVVVGAYREDSGATGLGGNQGDDSAANSGAAYVWLLNESCDDGNVCTSDSCSLGFCVHTANAGPCATGTCAGGVCK